MPIHTWWLFVGMTFVVSATPGPNMLLIMTVSAHNGVKKAVATMAGCMTSLMMMLGASAAGMGALLHAFPTIFDAMRLAGAAYLAWLGIASWRAPVAPKSTAADENSPVATSTLSLYRTGVLVAASNPKAILFAAAFFPQFIDPVQPAMGQIAILLLTFSVIEIAWYLVYAASGQRLRNYLQKPAVMQMFNRGTGAIFVGFAALMALSRN